MLYSEKEMVDKGHEEKCFIAFLSMVGKFKNSSEILL